MPRILRMDLRSRRVWKNVCAVDIFLGCGVCSSKSQRLFAMPCPLSSGKCMGGWGKAPWGAARWVGAGESYRLGSDLLLSEAIKRGEAVELSEGNENSAFFGAVIRTTKKASYLSLCQNNRAKGTLRRAHQGRNSAMHFAPAECRKRFARESPLYGDAKRRHAKRGGGC